MKKDRFIVLCELDRKNVERYLNYSEDINDQKSVDRYEVYLRAIDRNFTQLMIEQYLSVQAKKTSEPQKFYSSVEIIKN